MERKPQLISSAVPNYRTTVLKYVESMGSRRAIGLKLAQHQEQILDVMVEPILSRETSHVDCAPAGTLEGAQP